MRATSGGWPLSPASEGLTPTIDVEYEVRKRELEHRRRNGTSWFYSVAGLSVINSIILMTGGTWSFIFGLGITQVVDALSMSGASGEAGPLPATALIVDIVIAAGVAIVGYLAFRGHTSAYVAGMALYALDGLIFVVAGDYLAAGFHGFALWGMWRGLSAHRELLQLSPRDQDTSSAPGGAA